MAAPRELGHSGLRLAPLVLGGNVFGWTADYNTSFAVLDAFVAGGGNAIDTADVYSAWAPGHQGGGQSETVIGKWLAQRGRRDDVLIFTKVGMELGDGKKGLSKAYIKQAVEASLKRLQTDYIDLYQSHKDDESLPVSEPLEAYAELLKEGKSGPSGPATSRPSACERPSTRAAKTACRATRVSSPSIISTTTRPLKKTICPSCGPAASASFRTSAWPRVSSPVSTAQKPT